MTPKLTTMSSPPMEGSEEDIRAWAESFPVSQAMGLTCEAASAGHVRVVLTDAHWPLNPNGAVHGGIVTAWADHCCGLAALTAVPAGNAPATATLTAQFLRPSFAPLTFNARVDRAGARLAFVSVDVTDASGRECAKFTGTMSIGTVAPDADRVVSS